MNFCHRRFWKLFCCTPLALASGGLFSGCHQSKPSPPPDPSSMIHDVPIFPGPKLAPLDASALSGGKITRYILGGSNPNDPVQEATLEACRGLPIKDATAKSAYVVLRINPYGKMPVSALVVGNTTLVSLGQVLRCMRTGYEEYKGVTVFYPYLASNMKSSPGSIGLIRRSKWAIIGGKYALVDNRDYAFVGGKRITLQQPIYCSSRAGIIVTLHDLLVMFHASDLQRGNRIQTIQSAEVSYEPNASKLYSAPR